MTTTVERQKGGLVDDEHGGNDNFPVGMRVLAVDDDRVWLNILEQMLKQCRYNVTTTTQSIKALEMLRKNKDQFDLVISDVKMPDMDGFKLLEQVGLEMDLPVIMISVDKDINSVKKGVLHGACDYLLKPCRIEELQNIWQHVFRRQIDHEDHSKLPIEEKACIEEKASNVSREGSQAIIVSKTSADQNIQLGKRRNEQDEEEEEEDDDTEPESEDPSTPKKPRLIWSRELHGKFVAAVTQLGPDKAVPKKILELMNDKGLTRENVASHLQKYRLGLRKSAEQTNMVAALGVSDPYLPSLDGYASASARFSRSTLPLYASGGVFSRLNSSSGLNLRGTSSSALAWPVQSQNLNGTIKSLENIQPPVCSANQRSNSLPGIPAAVELNRFQQSSYTTGIRNFSPVDNLSGFSVSPVFANSRVNANSPLSVFSSNHLLLQGNSSATHNSLELRNHHSSLGAASGSTKPFDTGICSAPNLHDYNRCNESGQIALQLSGQIALQLSKFPANSLPLSQTFNNDQLPQNSLKFSSSTSHTRNIQIDFSSTHAIVPSEEPRGGLQCQEGLIGSIVQASCHKPQQSSEQHKKDYKQSTNQSSNSLVPSNGGTSSLGHTPNQSSSIGMKRADASPCGRPNEGATPSASQRADASLAGQPNEATPSASQRSEAKKVVSSDSRMKSNDTCTSQKTKSPQEEINPSDFESLDDIIVDMVKPELNGILLMNPEMVFDNELSGGSFI